MLSVRLVSFDDEVTPETALLAEEFFDESDPRFLGVFRATDTASRVAALADRWVRDSRPWAREQAHAYFALPLSCPGHHAVLKRWLRHAEGTGDAEVMGLLMVACDGLVRRRLVGRQLHSVRDSILPGLTFDRTPGTLRPWGTRSKARGDTLYSYATRYYLRRRTWRWFRRLGFQRPDEYTVAVAEALRRYTDEGLQNGAALLDSWGLLHACFFKSPVLRFDASRAHLTEGRGLSELEPAPAFPELWGRTDAVAVLIGLVTRAPSRLVRMWAIKVLQARHATALRVLDLDSIVALIDHGDEDVQQFGAACLDGHEELPTLTVDRWLRLLRVESPLALASICSLMATHVRPERLDDAQCIVLTASRPTAIAQLGLSLLERRDVTDRGLLVKLADAKCEAVGAAAARFALQRFDRTAAKDGDAFSRFLDSLNRRVRLAAWDWLLAHPAPPHDAPLFVRLTETPHDDLRFRLVDELERRAALPGLRGDGLVPVWASVLLGVHRGGRRKPKAVRQIADAIIDDPERANGLLPVLCIAVRSVRAPERAAGLTGIATVLTRRTELRARVAELLPDLSFESGASGLGAPALGDSAPGEQA